jgi:hypothetical protein
MRATVPTIYDCILGLLCLIHFNEDNRAGNFLNRAAIDYFCPAMSAGQKFVCVCVGLWLITSGGG